MWSSCTLPDNGVAAPRKVILPEVVCVARLFSRAPFHLEIDPPAIIDVHLEEGPDLRTDHLIVGRDVNRIVCHKRLGG